MRPSASDPWYFVRPGSLDLTPPDEFSSPLENLARLARGPLHGLDHHGLPEASAGALRFWRAHCSILFALFCLNLCFLAGLFIWLAGLFVWLVGWLVGFLIILCPTFRIERSGRLARWLTGSSKEGPSFHCLPSSVSLCPVQRQVLFRGEPRQRRCRV